MASSGKKLRTGFTTGACAAAAAKAAVMLLFGRKPNFSDGAEVEIPLPSGDRVRFLARCLTITKGPSGPAASATIIKDGGDDPDVTNEAAIVATATMREGVENIFIRGGEGVGRVTKPGLSVAVGEAAITPVPRKMIRDAVMEAREEFFGSDNKGAIEITISVPEGESLARKTLNGRLGIIGGISILGTTGIVKPLSAGAWTATISTSMDVAKAAGCTEIVLSVGRISEKAHMKKYAYPEEAYVMMGDYLAFSLGKAREHGFRRIHISAQWAKMLKISMATPETHVRHGAIDPQKGADHLRRMGIPVPGGRMFNTARELYTELAALPGFPFPGFASVCMGVKEYAEEMAKGIPVIAHLVSYEGEIIGDSEESIYSRHRA
ncbi:MAG TPA: cobalt-precorrin-5B (C(1))-methyltransferase CbiD [Syntrophorhabdaceae bacterium]|jgi:cobalt-precorrin-5B (C1)-methyltransferase